MAFGVATANIPLLIGMMGITISGVLLPYHPFDYIYNHILADRMNKPKLPKRPAQLKFACSVATVWLFGTVLLFHNGLFLWGYIAGASLTAVAFTVATTDFCIPSLIWNTACGIDVVNQI